MLFDNETVPIVDRDRLIDAVEFHLRRALVCFARGRHGVAGVSRWLEGQAALIRNAVEDVLEEQKMLSERMGHVRTG